MKYWRKVHIYSFGYWRWLSIASAVITFVISVTGILLVHKNDFRFMDRTRISTKYLPDSYAQRLTEIREQQGTAEFYRDAESDVPLSWIVYDLHSGLIFGDWAKYYYDFIAVAMIILSVTGIYMYTILKPKLNKRRIPNES